MYFGIRHTPQVLVYTKCVQNSDRTTDIVCMYVVERQRERERAAGAERSKKQRNSYCCCTSVDYVSIHAATYQIYIYENVHQSHTRERHPAGAGKVKLPRPPKNAPASVRHTHRAHPPLYPHPAPYLPRQDVVVHRRPRDSRRRVVLEPPEVAHQPSSSWGRHT